MRDLTAVDEHEGRVVFYLKHYVRAVGCELYLFGNTVVHYIQLSWMMVIYVVALAVSILLSILPASVTRGLAHAANAIIAQRLWLVIAVLTTTVVAYGISYVIASRIFASREW